MLMNVGIHNGKIWGKSPKKKQKNFMNLTKDLSKEEDKLC